MATTPEDLREHLLAVLQAAPELPRGDREHLADVFLNELHAQFRLVPRPQSRAWSDGLLTTWSTFLQTAQHWWPVAALALGLVFLLPLLLFPIFVLFHAPFLALFLVFLLMARFGRLGMRRRRMMW
jgi:hypothetical protein